VHDLVEDIIYVPVSLLAPLFGGTVLAINRNINKMAIKKTYRYYFKTILIFILLCPFLVNSGNTGMGQGKEQKDSSRLTYEVEVNITQVDVVVTDKRGKRITDLKPGNFKIYEDGVLQPMTNFYEMKAMDVFTAVTDKKSGKLKEPGQPLPEPTAPVMNKIVFYFDNWQLHPLNRNWSIKKLEVFIRNNFTPGSNNQGMVVSLDQSLQVVYQFTSDPNRLIAALKEVKNRSGQSLMQMNRREELKSELHRIVEDTERFDRNTGFENAMDLARNYVNVEQNDLYYSLKSLSALISNLTGIKGRKVLIYVSDGLPINPGDEAFNFISHAYPSGNSRSEAMNYDATRNFKELTARCNANEITLYPINARGLESKIIGADKQAGWNIRKRGSGMVNLGARVQNDALALMARDTGGVAISSTNDIEKGLTRIKNDLHYYYSLGYRSLFRGDNRHHRLKVKLTGLDKKYNVRVRSGFKHVSEIEKIKETVMSRLFLKRIYNPLGLMARILPVEKMVHTKKLRLCVKLWIPINKLTLKPYLKEYKGKFEVYLMLKDTAGSVSPCRQLSKEVSIPVKDYDDAMKSNFPYIVEMYVDKGTYNISMAIRDVNGAAPSYIQLKKTI
jgi:VWFA-related protein